MVTVKTTPGIQRNVIPFRRKIFRTAEPYLYMLPAIGLLLLFTYYPFIKNTVLSFFTINKFREVRSFAGVANYARVLTDENFLRAIGNTFVYVLTTVPVSVVIGFALALLARKPRKLSMAYEATYAMSMAVSISVIAMIFELAYNPSMGAINKIFGVRLAWLTNPSTALLSILIVQIWSNIGYNFIFLFSGLRGISEDVLESARIDGAVGSKLLFKIIIPMVSPTLLFLLVKDIAYAMTTASLTLIFSNGKPSAATETIVSYIYSKGIVSTNYNAAFAATTVGFVLSALMMALSLILDKKGVHYD